MKLNRNFYEQSQRFRNQVSVDYSSVRRVARQAYLSDSESELDSRFFNEAGLANISNMLVVYIWTLFEDYMKQAYVAIHDDKLPKDDDVRRRNRGWKEMRKWLSEKDMFNKNLGKFDELLSEFCARCNCLVHQNGLVDKRYIDQIRELGGESDFSVGDRILTDWVYHKKLADALVNEFNVELETEVSCYPRYIEP